CRTGFPFTARAENDFSLNQPTYHGVLQIDAATSRSVGNALRGVPPNGTMSVAASNDPRNPRRLSVTPRIAAEAVAADGLLGLTSSSSAERHEGRSLQNATLLQLWPH
ncbi:MAG: hypothetical protein K2X38_21555, partial [Gemmataceae bacterium]|nr:hypothetical protein [Gemmataceae bacterium]